MGVQDHEPFYQTIRAMDDEMIHAFFHSVHNYNVLALGFVSTAVVALLMQIIHMDAEWRTLRELSKGKVMPARLAVIFIRWNYLVTFMLVSVYFFGYVPAAGCEPLVKTIYALFTALWAMAGAIFLMRLKIIYAREPLVNAFFLAMWLCVVGSWIYVTTQIKSTSVPVMLRYPYAPSCVPERFPRRAVAGWVASLIFDCSVFIATYVRFHGLRAAKDQRLRSRQWLLQSNMQYFGTSMILNTSLMLTILLVNDAQLSHMGSAFAFVAQTVMATRLVFHAKGWSAGEGEDDMVLNTFNRNRDKRGRGNTGMVSQLSFVVDQMVVADLNGSRDDGPNHDVEGQTGQHVVNGNGIGSGAQSRSRSSLTELPQPVPAHNFGRTFHHPFRRPLPIETGGQGTSHQLETSTDKEAHSFGTVPSSEQVNASGMASSLYLPESPSHASGPRPATSSKTPPRSPAASDAVPPPYISREPPTSDTDHHAM